MARSVERPRGDGLDTLIHTRDLIAGGQLARCLTTKTRIDAETETLIPTFGGRFVDPVAGTLQANGKAAGSATQQDAESGMLVPVAFDSRQDCVSSTEVFGALGSSSPQAQAISYAIQAGALRTNPNSGPDGVGVQADVAYTLEARSEVQAVCFSAKDHGADATIELAPTMRAMGHQRSHANGGGQLAVVVTSGSREIAGALTSSYGKQPDGSDSALGPNLAICITGDVTHCLKAEGFDASEDGTGRGQPIVAAFAENSRGELRLEGGDGSRTGTLSTGGGKPGQGTPMAQVGMAVRRLTPRECERLQGFADDYTLVPHRGKPMADGPRYKALGNSWAVPNVAWIGRRIAAEMARAGKQDEDLAA